jgi:hypothetical protein
MKESTTSAIHRQNKNQVIFCVVSITSRTSSTIWRAQSSRKYRMAATAKSVPKHTQQIKSKTSTTRRLETDNIIHLIDHIHNDFRLYFFFVNIFDHHLYRRRTKNQTTD